MDVFKGLGFFAQNNLRIFKGLGFFCPKKIKDFEGIEIFLPKKIKDFEGIENFLRRIWRPGAPPGEPKNYMVLMRAWADPRSGGLDNSKSVK